MSFIAIHLLLHCNSIIFSFDANTPIELKNSISSQKAQNLMQSIHKKNKFKK